MSVSVTVIMVALFILGYVVAPVTLVWGWIRWTQHPKTGSIPSILSVSGFILATGSATLAICSTAYAHMHPFEFYDPTLMRIFRWGMMMSLAAFLLALAGIGRNSSLRWHAPLCALGMFSFWVIAAEGE